MEYPKRIEKDLKVIIDVYKTFCACLGERVELLVHYLMRTIDYNSEGYFFKLTNSMSPYILDMLTCFNQNWNNNDAAIYPQKTIFDNKRFMIVRDFHNGEKKLTAMKNAPQKRGKRNTEEFKKNDRKLYNSISRSKNAVYELAVCNSWDYGVILTIDQECFDRYDRKAIMKAFLYWLRIFSKKNIKEGKIAYVFVPEMHKDGAWHIHGLIKGLPKEHLTFVKKEKGARYYQWDAYEKKFGISKIFTIRNIKKFARYITKFIKNPSKVQRTMELYSRLYYCSQGLRRSTVVEEGYDLMYMDYEYENEYIGTGWFYE